MLPNIESLLRDPKSELVFGLVAPIGADLDGLETDLSNQLRLYGYDPNPVRLSKLLKKTRGLGIDLKETNELDRLTSYMDAGDRLRQRSGSGEILALWAMTEIRSERDKAQPVRARTAHILRSLKHPDEARALRAVYGSGFFLLGLSASQKQKLRLLEQRGLTTSQAEIVIKRDAGDDDDRLGQQTREVFELADVHIRQDPERDKTTEQVERFLRLVFGNVVEPPTVDENAMFLAYAAAMRSADLSRQVGAVVWKEGTGVVATGCNDVHGAGGGAYVTGKADQRDHVRGVDANEQYRSKIVEDVAGRIGSSLGLPDEQLALVREICRGSKLADVTEFGRPVHAEMDALLSCARAGISTRDSTVFSTTFPCHNCARHIIAAGVRRVVYIEPYAKSMAIQLHSDAIAPDDQEESDAGHGSKVRFEAFVGVGPRRYFDLFSMRLSDGYALRRKQAGRAVAWDRNSAAIVRVPMLPTSYLEREAQLAQIVPAILERSPDDQEDHDQRG